MRENETQQEKSHQLQISQAMRSIHDGCWLRVGIVLLAIPFSLVGAIWLLYFLEYEL